MILLDGELPVQVQSILAVMLPICFITVIIAMGGGFEKRPKK